jgi:hypothetical protein
VGLILSVIYEQKRRNATNEVNGYSKMEQNKTNWIITNYILQGKVKIKQEV